MDKILFIRRDNIGDLLCTTPAIRAVRVKYPHARIGILVNSYNVDAVAGNPDIDDIYVYQKAKHVPDRNRLLVWWDNLRIMKLIRDKRYDIAIACGSYSPTLEKYACAIKAHRQVGFKSTKKAHVRYTDPIDDPGLPEHEVMKTWRLLEPLDINVAPGASFLFPDRATVEEFIKFRAGRSSGLAKPLVAIAISARVEKHRWPLEKFAALIERVLTADQFEVMILWAPGKRDNPTFPGDDEAADILIKQFGERILAYPAKQLKETIAALSEADMVVTLDTGSLHMAAALGKPTVALMRESNVPLWHPWQVPQVLVTTKGNVAEIGVAEVFSAICALAAG